MTDYFIVEMYNENGNVVGRRIVYTLNLSRKSRTFTIIEPSNPSPFCGLEIWNYCDDPPILTGKFFSANTFTKYVPGKNKIEKMMIV
jgi:hypothetical protein